MPPLAIETFARAVDHTLLDPAAATPQIDALCDQAAAHGLHAVCVYPWWVARAVARLDGRAAVCTVVGFPHGLDPTAAKLVATRAAVSRGAAEIDVVMAYGALASGETDAVAADLAAVVEAAHGQGALVKVIVESARLSGDQLRSACRIVAQAGADFAKTSTGLAGPATVEAVELMRETLPATVRVKASGGIRTAQAAAAMLDAGAARLGTSATLAIIDELRLNAVA